MDTFLNYSIVFLLGSIFGVLAMLTVEAWQDRREDAQNS